MEEALFQVFEKPFSNLKGNKNLVVQGLSWVLGCWI